MLAAESLLKPRCESRARRLEPPDETTTLTASAGVVEMMPWSLRGVG
jgi:hypothetical protein